VTNGFWAITEDIAKERLQRLQLSGLVEINFSTGDFHQKFVPLDRVVSGALAAISLGMRTVIMVEIRKDRSFSKEKLLKDHRLSRIMQNQESSNLLSIVESPWMPVYDSEIVPQEKHLLVNAKNVHLRRGCDTVLSSFVVTPSQGLGACCGLTREQIPELNLGSLEDKSMKQMIQEAFDDFLKLWIYVDGPEKILSWAATIDPSIQWEDKYAHICHACLALYKDPKVRKVIREHHHEKLLDVYFKYWLLTSYKPDTSITAQDLFRDKDTRFFFG